MRTLFLTGAIALFLFAPSTAPAVGLDEPAQVTLIKPCERPVPTGCVVHVGIDGTIGADTAQKFVAVLNDEIRKSGPIIPHLHIASPGGDVNAAMQIGEVLRKTRASVFSGGPCHSACVFIAVGAVERNLSGIGVHRPFFAQTQAHDFAEADQRYKKMIRSVRAYLDEMNISDDLMRIMLAVPPGEMQVLSPVEAKRIGINGIDPAWDEFRTAQEARTYGLTSAELRKRQAQIEVQCGREELMRSLAEVQKRDTCRTNIREKILWGLTEDKIAQLRKMEAQLCTDGPATADERRQCTLILAQKLRSEGDGKVLTQSSSR